MYLESLFRSHPGSLRLNEMLQESGVPGRNLLWNCSWGARLCSFFWLQSLVRDKHQRMLL